MEKKSIYFQSSNSDQEISTSISCFDTSDQFVSKIETESLKEMIFSGKYFFILLINLF